MESHPTTNVTHTATTDQLPCGCTVAYSVADGRNVFTVTRCKADCAVISLRVTS